MYIRGKNFNQFWLDTDICKLQLVECLSQNRNFCNQWFVIVFEIEFIEQTISSEPVLDFMFF